MENWAKKLTEAHKNPITKLELCGSKLFLPAKTEQETELIKTSLKSFSNAICNERVERRCTRATANWLPESKLAEVTKAVGILQNFGFANKLGRFLYPKEVMFLLETNRLELFWNNLPVSIQQAYEIILKGIEDSVEDYVVYRKLVLEGFRLVHGRHIIQKQEKIKEPSRKKQKLLQDCSIEYNIKQSSFETISAECGSKVNDFDEIFSKLRENGPRKFEQVLGTVDSDRYKLFFPDNASKTSSDFDLRVYQGKHIQPGMSLLQETTPLIVGYTNSQFVGYFRMGNVDLPNLT